MTGGGQYTEWKTGLAAKLSNQTALAHEVVYAACRLRIDFAAVQRETEGRRVRMETSVGTIEGGGGGSSEICWDSSTIPM